MIPLQTLKMLNRKIRYSKEKMSTEPKKYTYMYESLKQLRTMLLLEFKLMNKQLFN